MAEELELQQEELVEEFLLCHATVRAFPFCAARKKLSWLKNVWGGLTTRYFIMYNENEQRPSDKIKKEICNEKNRVFIYMPCTACSPALLLHKLCG
jgi:hypothetical protein